MRWLLVVALASACGGAVPLQTAPVVMYPRGTHVIDHSARCNLSWLERAIDYNITCGVVFRR